MAAKSDRTKPNSEALKKAALLDALEKSLGVVTTACKAVGIGRTQFYEYMKTDEQFAEAVRDMDEVVLDFAESQLHKQIKENSTAATIFFLKTKGKKRGYIETQELKQDITTRTSDLTDEELNKEIKRLERIRDIGNTE